MQGLGELARNQARYADMSQTHQVREKELIRRTSLSPVTETCTLNPGFDPGSDPWSGELDSHSPKKTEDSECHN